MTPVLTWPALVSTALRLGFGGLECHIGWGETGLVEYMLHELLHAHSLGLPLKPGLMAATAARLTTHRDHGRANEALTLAAEGLMLARTGLAAVIELEELDLAAGRQDVEPEHVWSLRRWSRTKGLARQVEEWLRGQAATRGAHPLVIHAMLKTREAAGWAPCCVAELLARDVADFTFINGDATPECAACLQLSAKERADERLLRSDTLFERNTWRHGSALEIYKAVDVLVDIEDRSS